jgi:hypothetical protein
LEASECVEGAGVARGLGDFDVLVGAGRSPGDEAVAAAHRRRDVVVAGRVVGVGGRRGDGRGERRDDATAVRVTPISGNLARGRVDDRGHLVGGPETPTVAAVAAAEALSGTSAIT